MRDAVNIQAVQLVADGLKDLRDQVVFVGGSVISLYANDPGADVPRPTSDIDLVIVVSTYAEYERLEVRLRELGFHHSPEDKIMCRYRYHGVMVDIMPTDVPAIGPTNKWYVPGMEHAVDHALPDGSLIKLLTAPYFLATKLEAFKSRGGDMRTSKDFEDIVFILDSRLGLMDELLEAPPEVSTYLKKEFGHLLKRKGFDEAIAGHLDQRVASARATMILEALARSVISKG
ncbi:MAG: nucleotidyl transferase AbiEii/AbiGii toxin family protein [Flavobacteriales bacterium]|nr:nucleotidyl transferase AbiEii/AbiGii toxin family protein [Flavobacteriales bacterium]